MKKIFLLFLMLPFMISSIVFAAGQAEEETEEGNVLTIYGALHQQEARDFVVEEAKKQLGLEVRVFVGGGGGEIFDRIMAEGKNTQADVIMQLLQPSMIELKDKGHLQPYVPSWGADTPEHLKDSDGYYHMYSWIPTVIAYNADFVKGDMIPKKWTDLADPKYNGMFTVFPLTSQTSRTIHSGMLWRFADHTTGKVSEEGWDFMRKIYANYVAWSDGNEWRSKCINGEMPIMLSHLGGLLIFKNDNNLNMEFVTTDTVPGVAEALAISKYTTNIENAKKFIEWFGSPEIQAAYSNITLQAPAHPDAIPNAPESVRKTVVTFEPQNLDWTVSSKAMDEWLETLELDILP